MGVEEVMEEADRQAVDLGMRDPRHYRVERSPNAQRCRTELIIILRARLTPRPRPTLTNGWEKTRELHKGLGNLVHLNRWTFRQKGDRICYNSAIFVV
jgi:hypothetical protein